MADVTTYLRVYSDDAGESHFEEVELRGEIRSAIVSSAVSAYADVIPATDLIIRRVVDETAPDEFHNAPRRQFVIPLVGELELEVSDGTRRRVAPGALVFVEDVTGRGHISRNVGDQPRVTAFVVVDRDWTGS